MALSFPPLVCFPPAVNLHVTAGRCGGDINSDHPPTRQVPTRPIAQEEEETTFLGLEPATV